MFMSSDIFSVFDSDWCITEDSYCSEKNLQYESLFALSNGYLGIRGAHEEGTSVSLPYVYINGIFDKSETFMKELATLPNWLGVRLYLEKQCIGIEDCEIIQYRRWLDMKRACLRQYTVLRDKKGRDTQIDTLRFVSRAHRNRMAVVVRVIPLNYNGLLEIEHTIDGSIINFCDAPRFKVKHTELTRNNSLSSDGTYLEVATRDDNIHVAVGARLLGYEYDNNFESTVNILQNRCFHAFGERGVEFCDVSVQCKKPIILVKYVAVKDSRDTPVDHLFEDVESEINAMILDGVEKELQNHIAVYEKMWDHADIEIAGDNELNRAIRFNIFHLMSSANEEDNRVNIGAKLLSGEEYGGHAFWDSELFMLPFFAFVFPNTARKLEEYRYNLLPAAKRNAKKNGLLGAQYPWESADDGSEQCPDWTIEPDGTCYRCYVAQYEQHVTAAIAFGVAKYLQITHDHEFLYSKGINILLETARFWVSRCEWVEKSSRYEINQVTGPDEWHEPVNNNTYTNYLARWNIRYSLQLLSQIKVAKPEKYSEIIHNSDLTQEEIAHWKYVADHIYLPKDCNGIIEQFEGYFNLKDVVISQYDENDWPIRPAALKEYPVEKTQIIKQPDVVMLMHLLRNEFSKEVVKNNYHFYEARTLHGSSLSPSIHAIMGLVVGDDSKAYRYIKRSATLDLLNLQGNTREGIHAANAGGVWQTVIFGFAGININAENVLTIDPKLPARWKSIVFRLHYAGRWLEINISSDKVEVHILQGRSMTILIHGAPVVINGCAEDGI